MSGRIPVILNPAARSTQAAAREQAIRALSPEPELVLTGAPGQAANLAEELARAGHPLVVADPAVFHGRGGHGVAPPPAL